MVQRQSVKHIVIAQHMCCDLIEHNVTATELHHSQESMCIVFWYNYSCYACSREMKFQFHHGINYNANAVDDLSAMDNVTVTSNAQLSADWLFIHYCWILVCNINAFTPFGSDVELAIPISTTRILLFIPSQRHPELQFMLIYYCDMQVNWFFRYESKPDALLSNIIINWKYDLFRRLCFHTLNLWAAPRMLNICNKLRRYRWCKHSLVAGPPCI